MAANALSPEIQKFARNIIENGKIGTCKDYLKIERPRSGSNVTRENNCDRFKLLIPYGGVTLKWEILFNSGEAHFPPDFIFENSEADFEPNLEEMLSLQLWNPDDPSSLTAVVKDLMEQFKLYQYELVKKYSAGVEAEFRSVQELDISSCTEVYVHRNPQVSQQQANFVIKLPIDLAKLPAYLVNSNPSEDYITLFVSFEGYDGSTVTPKIFLSPRVEHAFADMYLQFPNWTDSDDNLASYVLNVQGYFNEKVQEIIEGYERRREYFSAFLSCYGTSVLEYDVETFSRISFLMQVESFFCIVTIEINRDFPEEQPAFVMKSIYHQFSDEPYEAVDKDYPYSPRWSAQEMASRARSYLTTAIPQFKLASMSNRPYYPPGL